MGRWLVRIWLVLTPLLALGLAGTYFAGPEVSAPADWTLDDQLSVTGSHWVATAVVLIAASAFAGNTVLGWLLVAWAVRGVADAAASVAAGYPPAAYPALITAALTAVAAAWLLRHGDDAQVWRARPGG